MKIPSYIKSIVCLRQGRSLQTFEGYKSEDANLDREMLEQTCHRWELQKIMRSRDLSKHQYGKSSQRSINDVKMWKITRSQIQIYQKGWYGESQQLVNPFGPGHFFGSFYKSSNSSVKLRRAIFLNSSSNQIPKGEENLLCEGHCYNDLGMANIQPFLHSHGWLPCCLFTWVQ